MESKIVRKRFGEIWQQAEALTTEQDEGEAVVMFMQRYGELIVRECLHMIREHPLDAAERIASTYEINPDVSVE